jgi:hypothetical protein
LKASIEGHFESELIHVEAQTLVVIPHEDLDCMYSEVGSAERGRLLRGRGAAHRSDYKVGAQPVGVSGMATMLSGFVQQIRTSY